MLRKLILGDRAAAGAPRADVKDIPALATVLVTSEAPEHPVDHLFDASAGPGGTRWIAGADGEQTLVLAFDAPQSIRAIGIEAEEPSATRTNVLTISLSEDGGRTYQERIRQEFNFSPRDHVRTRGMVRPGGADHPCPRRDPAGQGARPAPRHPDIPDGPLGFRDRTVKERYRHPF